MPVEVLIKVRGFSDAEVLGELKASLDHLRNYYGDEGALVELTHSGRFSLTTERREVVEADYRREADAWLKRRREEDKEAVPE